MIILNDLSVGIATNLKLDCPKASSYILNGRDSLFSE